MARQRLGRRRPGEISLDCSTPADEDTNMQQRITLTVNGADRHLTIDPETPLLYALRNDLGLSSPRQGCSQEQCGACRVIMDGEAMYACTAKVKEANNRRITTVEGVSIDGALHPVQQAILDENAAQCGYCLSGIINRAALLLEKNPSPDRSDIQTAFKDHLCRCGAHNRIIRAIQNAAREMHHD
jgi:nicotinate dehydrogenase subunit A